MNINGFGGIFAFSVIWLLSRFAFSWIKNLSYASSGKTMRSVEKHYDQVKMGKIPYEKEIDWLVSVSSRPRITKALYVLYYVLTSLGLAGIALSVVNLFTTALDTFISKAALGLIALCMFSLLCCFLFYEPISYLMRKKE